MDKSLQIKIIFIFLTFNVLSISSLYYLLFKPSSRTVSTNPLPWPHFQPMRHTISSYYCKALARMVKRQNLTFEYKFTNLPVTMLYLYSRLELGQKRKQDSSVALWMIEIAAF